MILATTMGSSSAASCCGGSVAAPLILSKFQKQMVDLSYSMESYDGYWDQDGNVQKDPPQSELSQNRLQLGFAQRWSSRWQSSISLPFVWTDNQYAGLHSKSEGLGDSQIGLSYEAFDGIQCVFEVRDWRDLIPATYFGLNLTIPTGISPYDDEDNNFDITGLGFYRLDASVLLDKTIYPWTIRTSASYGIHFERPVNQEYGQAVEPYDKKLGNRITLGLGFAYSKVLANAWSWTAALDAQYLEQGKESFDGREDANSGYHRSQLIPSLSFHSPSKKWVLKSSYRHSPRSSTWGENFSITDTFSFGVSHVLQ